MSGWMHSWWCVGDLSDCRFNGCTPPTDPIKCPVTWRACDCTGEGGCCRLHHMDGRKCADDCVGPVAAVLPEKH